MLQTSKNEQRDTDTKLEKVKKQQQLEQCIYRASHPSQGTVNGGAISK